MLKPFSQYLKAVEEYLPSEHHQLLRNGLYLALLDWYTDGSNREKPLLGLALRSRDRLLPHVRAAGGLVGMRRWSIRCAMRRADILLVVLKGW